MATVRHYFKKVRGRWKRYRGNPLRKNVKLGHYDKGGKFHAVRAYAPRRARKTRRRKR